MPGFPLAAIGAGIGQGVQQIDQHQAAMLQQVLQQLKLKQQQQQDQASAALFSTLASGGIQPLSPGGGGGLNLPGSTMPQMDTGGGGFSPPPRTQSGADMGGGLRAGGALAGNVRPPVGSPENQRITDLIVQDESGGRNIKQQIVPAGGGYNPSVGRVTGPSSAQGLGQFTDPTWRDASSRIGAGQYAHAMDAPPEVQRQAISQRVADKGVGDWAPYNKTLARHLGIAAPSSHPVAREAQETALGTAQSIPPEVYGRMSLQALAQQIDKANPSADPVVKMMALEQAAKLLAPSEQRAWEMFRQEHQDKFSMALQDRQDDRQTRALAAGQDREDARDRRFLAAQGADKGADWQIEKVGDQPVRVNRRSGEVKPLEMPAGLTGPISRIGTSSQSAPDPKNVEGVAQRIAKYDMAPISGAGRSPWSQAVMKRVTELNPQYDQTKYNQKLRGQIAFTSGKQGDAIRRFSVSIDHLAIAEEAAQALAQNDTQRLNQLQNIFAKEFGAAGVPDFNLVKTIVGGEVSTAILGGMGGQKERDELRDTLSAANSPEQLAAVADKAKQLIASQLGGFRRQAGSSGFSEADFEAALSPRAKAELESREQPAPGAPRAAAPTAAAPPAAIEELKKNPSIEMQKQFDQIFGEGAAAAAIGK